MAQRLNILNKLISHLRTGAGYYRRAARQTDYEDREEVFLSHALVRETHANTLAAIIEDVGGEVQSIHPVEKGWEVIGRLWAWSSETEKRLVFGLEEHEDRTLAAFRDAIAHKDTDRDTHMLEQMLTDFEATHDRMRALKHRIRKKKRDTATPAAEHQPDAWKAAPDSASDGASTAQQRVDGTAGTKAKPDPAAPKAAEESPKKAA
ncbi:hypothetical protein [Pseudaestuariivita sp.]|uniref:hypothetical protein n=1 Tax=Pseudaestuariivita sp. TaxID=2211669 RepID=UPI0040590B41